MKALVHVNPDLASSIALRYACRLAGLGGFEVQPIHVQQPDETGTPPPGSGWARKSWEKALADAGRAEIAQLINAERDSCPAMAEPRLRVGEREEELLAELASGSYALFIEGAGYDLTPAQLHSRLRSRLYRGCGCPVVIVRSLPRIERICLALAAKAIPERLVEALMSVLGGAQVDVDVLYCKFPSQLVGPTLSYDPSQALSSASRALEARGLKPQKLDVLEAEPEEAARALGDYGLVVASAVGHKRTSPVIRLLAELVAPTMVLVGG